MKKPITILLAAAICTLGACNKKDKDAVTVHNFGVDVQSYFKKDKVQLLLDGEKILDKTLTTNEVLGVCPGDGQLKRLLGDATHTLKVVVNDTITESNTFTTTRDVYIGVGYVPATKDITFLFSDEPFVYD